jgi:hypothetical protein
VRCIFAAFLVTMITLSAAPAPMAIECAAGRILWLSGSGAPRTPLLIYFAGRPVGGGSVDRAGHWALPLQVGRERPGLYAIEVRSRNDRALLAAFTCAVGVAVSTPAPAPPTAIVSTPIGAAPITDTTCPADHLVKGNIVGRGENIGEKIYHLPGDNGYTATNPERCFVNAAEAEAAGYRPVK